MSNVRDEFPPFNKSVSIVEYGGKVERSSRQMDWPRDPAFGGKSKRMVSHQDRGIYVEKLRLKMK